MGAPSLEQDVTDYALAVLLRYFRSLSVVSLHRPLVVIERDREMLQLHWSLSPSTSELVSYALTHHHEIHTVLDSRVRIEDGVVRGRPDAVETLRLRRISGLATAVVGHEPIRSYESGPNHVLGWVLTQAWTLASRFAKLTFDSPAYQSVIDASLQRLEQCRRLQAVTQITGPNSRNRRPTANALIEATRSRHRIYRLAAKAYRSLLAIEAGDLDTIGDMLRVTLFAPLEPWRRFELAIGLGIGEALSLAAHTQLLLNLMIGDVRRTIAETGPFEIHWQSRTNYYSVPQAEPSERIVRQILDAYGLSASSDRPDIVVINRVADRVEAIIEAKYLTGGDGSDRVRDAAAQLVRYAKGYCEIDDCGPLLGRSLIALSQGLGEIANSKPLPATVPLPVDFAGIMRGQLAEWAQQRLSVSGSA